MNIRFIDNESNFLAYRTARGDAKCLQSIETLKEELQALKVDVLKLNLHDATEDLYERLNQLGYPYYVLGVTLEYKSNFVRNEIKPYLNQELEFVEYKGEESKMFKELVASIFKDSPASYFSNPGLKDVVDQEKQVQCLAEYIATLNASFKPNQYTHLMYYKGELAGFICSYKEGDGGGATYSGLLKQFENKGLYLDMIRFIQNYGKEIGQKWGTTSVQVQNTVVQKAYQKNGMIPNGYSLNVHVNCFLGELKQSET